jgi:hypothetical protein
MHIQCSVIHRITHLLLILIVFRSLVEIYEIILLMAGKLINIHYHAFANSVNHQCSIH